MKSLEKAVKRGGHESDQHMQLKRAAKSGLMREGYQATAEADIGDSCKADILGVHEGKRPVIVECETLLELQKKLTSTFQKAHIRHGQIDAILCIPKFIEFAEIWCVGSTGKIRKYKEV